MTEDHQHNRQELDRLNKIRCGSVSKTGQGTQVFVVTMKSPVGVECLSDVCRALGVSV